MNKKEKEETNEKTEKENKEEVKTESINTNTNTNTPPSSIPTSLTPDQIEILKKGSVKTSLTNTTTTPEKKVEKVCKKKDNNESYLEELFQKGIEYKKKKQFSVSILCFSTYLSLKPCEKVFVELGYTYGGIISAKIKSKESNSEVTEKDGKVNLAEDVGSFYSPKKAINVFEKCLKLFPNSSETFYGLGVVYMKLSNEIDFVLDNSAHVKIIQEKKNDLGKKRNEYIKNSIKYFTKIKDKYAFIYFTIASLYSHLLKYSYDEKELDDYFTKSVDNYKISFDKEIDLNSIFSLGYFYDFGKKVTIKTKNGKFQDKIKYIDKKKALDYYLQGCLIKHSPCMNNCANIFKNDVNLEVSFNEVERIRNMLYWYKNSADLGNINAMYSLSYEYGNGKILKKNKKLEKYWLDTFIEKANDEELFEFSINLQNGKEDFPIDLEKSLKLLFNSFKKTKKQSLQSSVLNSLCNLKKEIFIQKCYQEKNKYYFTDLIITSCKL